MRKKRIAKLFNNTNFASVILGSSVKQNDSRISKGDKRFWTRSPRLNRGSLARMTGGAKLVNNSKSPRGFTLLELIIVVALVSSLSIAGIVAYRDYSQRQSLETAADDLAAVIQLAKSRAISQVKPSDCGTQSLDGYRINIPFFSAPEYTISAICEGNAYDIKTFKLARGIKFDADATTILPGIVSETGIFFPIITLGVQGGGDIVLKGQSNKKVKVSVDSVGTIRVQLL